MRFAGMTGSELKRDKINKTRDLRRGTVSAVLPDPPGVVDLAAVENGDVVVAAVVISLHVKLLKLDFDDLQRNRREFFIKYSPKMLRMYSGPTFFFTWFFGATMCQEQVTPAG